MIDNATQGGLWDRAQLYGARSREKLATWNDAKVQGATHGIRFGRTAKFSPYVSRRSIGVVFSHPDGSTPVEQMGAWLASLGLGYDAELGATRLEREPQAPQRAPVPRAMTAETKAPAAPAKSNALADSAIAEAFARFGKAPAFRRAFTARGQLRKGWTLVNGAPTWVEGF